jgi:hypothetical protein
MNNLINTYSDWLEEYKKNKYKVWIKVSLNNLQEFYLRDYNEWFVIKQICKDNSLYVESVALQYKSHSIEVETKNTDAVYLVRSILGSFGQDTKQTFTIGKLNGDIMTKSVWITPELLKEIEEEDKVESCFEEAIIYNYAKKR